MKRQAAACDRTVPGKSIFTPHVVMNLVNFRRCGRGPKAIFKPDVVINFINFREEIEASAHPRAP